MTRSTLADGLYVITDNSLIPPRQLTDCTALAIAGGAVVIQYRNKQASDRDRHAEATALVALCRRHKIPLIINDDADLAAAVGASGVHLGKTDPPIQQTRERLGPQAIIGVSCYNDIDRALVAARAGADYVAFGRFFPSRSKPDAAPAGSTVLRHARRQLDLPIVAIGGITPANGQPLLAAGANLLAAIHGIFGQPDIRAAAAQYADLFRKQDAANSLEISSSQDG
jgi:thiamine-phosphate pyrophosphorylase